MTVPESAVSLLVDMEAVEDAVMARRPATPPIEDQDAQLSAELQRVFGESVRAARGKAGLTQLELAGRTGISRVDISRIESGQINITIRTMSRLATAFQVGVAQMLNTSDGAEK